MASVLKDRGGWRIRFYSADGDRKQIRVPGVNKATAEKIGHHVDSLNAAKTAGDTVNRQTALWLADIGQSLHDKLAAAGLVDRREVQTLGAFVRGYIDRRTDVKPGTTMNYETVERNLVAFFGVDRQLRTVKPTDAVAFREWLRDHENQSENTIRRRCGRARQFFAAALKAGQVDGNPFDGMSVTVTGSEGKERFVTADESRLILEACPDAEWRLIFALCRWGGLRCPSEILPLTWDDVLWDRSRIIVRSPKTERYRGKGSRVIPMFPELVEPLSRAFAQAPEGAVHVVARYRDGNANLRTQFQRIIERAGITPWQKPFQNLRSTRETELMETYPAHVVVSWIGHSERVAQKHYLQLTDAHFERAVQSGVAPPVAPQTCETAKTGVPETEQPHEKHSDFRGVAGDCADEDYPVGTRTPTNRARICRATNYTTG